MRRLLLLFIFSPVVLFGQTRRKAIVDSIKAATDLHNVASVISNYPDSRVEHMQVADSGEYVTIVVRVHFTDGVITALSPLPVVNIKTGDMVTAALSIVTVPPILFPVTEALTPLGVTQFRIDDFVAARVETVPVPPLPHIELETEALTPLAPVKLVIKHFSADKMDTVAVPGYEEKKMPVAEMSLSANGYSLLEKLEGFSPEPYSLGDGGLTIGFGFFIPDGQGSKWDKGVTWEEAEIMIRQKVPTYENQVKQYINVPLTQEEFDALTMMAYNLGGFSKATSIVNDINSYADFDQLKKDWMRFVHSKAPGVMKGLMNRRRDELKVRAEADYQAERKIQIFKNRK